MNFVPVAWCLHSFQIYMHSRRLSCMFSWLSKGILTWRVGQDVLPLVSSRNFQAGLGALNTILRSKNFLLSIHCKENEALVITPSSARKVGYCEAAPCFKSGWDPTVIFCLLLPYLALQHCSYFVDLIKPLLAMKVQRKIYNRVKGKHPSAFGQNLRGSWQNGC